MTGREIREALQEGQPVYATAAIAPSSYWPGMLRQAGIDFVFLDTEHIPLGRETLAWMCRAGGNLIMHSSDLALFGQTLKRDLNQLRSALGDSRDAAGGQEKATV